jgi:predicted nucleotidyltransferase component of viral defense system
MSLFDRLVEEVLKENHELYDLRPVVEKELLHHEILRIMSEGGYLRYLTFMGGTCLRNCYSSPRMSEDLDFTGGVDFTRELMENMGDEIVRTISRKYDAHVDVGEPQQESGDTKTWKIRVDTQPSRPDISSQRIHIDICMLSSHEIKAAMLKNRYGVELGTSGLILNVESREEILADKYVALALRPNRVKFRDIWDIMWLSRNSVDVKPSLIAQKLQERGVHKSTYIEKLRNRVSSIADAHDGFLFELRRFLPQHTVEHDLENPAYWEVVMTTLREAYAEFVEYAE